MSELKTLKEMKDRIYKDKEGIQWRAIDEIELRDEAIKWLKGYKKPGCHICLTCLDLFGDEEYKKHYSHESPFSDNYAVTFIKRFFNITETDIWRHVK